MFCGELDFQIMFSLKTFRAEKYWVHDEPERQKTFRPFKKLLGLFKIHFGMPATKVKLYWVDWVNWNSLEIPESERGCKPPRKCLALPAILSKLTNFDQNIEIIKRMWHHRCL